MASSKNHEATLGVAVEEDGRLGEEGVKKEDARGGITQRSK